MKKNTYPLLLCASFLLLSACGKEENPPSSESSLDPGSSSSEISSSESSSTSSSSSSSIDYTIGWSQEVLDIMEPHLGGHAIPFIDLPGRILATWVEASRTYDYSTSTYITEAAHLSILSTGAFDTNLAGNAKLTYQKAGWTVDFDRVNVKMHAEDNELGIKVDFYGEYDDNDKMTNPQIDVFYDEPFIVPTSGSWRNATLEVLASIDVIAPHALPYVYLGTMAEEATMLTDSSAVEIQGRKESWDTYQNQILSSVRAVLKPSKKWFESQENVSSGTGYYATTYSGYAFTKTFSDGYTVKAVLYGRDASNYSYSSNPKTPYLRVTCSHQ